MLTEFLVKTFVKNSEETEQEQVRTAYGVLASVVGILCNVFLFGVKLAVGLVLGSIAVMADAFNNLSDAVSSVISFVGVKLAERPADREHPFGHGRYEYISAFIVSFLILEVGISFVKSAWEKIRNPQDITFSIVSLAILCLSVAVKLWLGRFNRVLGERIHSSVMKATAADAMGDAAATSATILCIAIYGIFGWNLDGYVGMLVAFMVLGAGIGVAKDTLEPLLGEAVDPELAKMLQKEVESYEGIVGSHDLIVHSYGPTKRMATIHAEVPNDVDIEKSHELIDRIEYEVFKKTRVFLVIHMDPVETKDQKVLAYRKKLEEIIAGLDEKVSFHDFRMVDGKKHVNLIFDLVVPFEYSEEEKEKLKENVKKRVKDFDSRCDCVILIEHSYVGDR
ncbi:MAG TPA: cation-efflux pump [Lachnospiraceae bacterium]|nr:cation-efflux pump [Lachnospiraceae bacterium]